MGNNSSSHQHHVSDSVAQEMGPGWAHSFPRELQRHHSQPPGHKVLPEPPNQRLRATNNGNIIHNGGTISGRRPSSLTLPHDLHKQGVFRTRSTSASNFGPSRPQNGEPQYFNNHQDDPRGQDTTDFKRFGSEPDLRFSPNDHGRQIRQQGYPDRDTRERESRYKGKKKYKAPPPPPNDDGSSPDSYKWEQVQNRETRLPKEIVPPPRKSRLFKTRAETKKAQANWVSLQERDSEIGNKRWPNGQSEKENLIWRQQEERWNREERRPKVFDGKNTLQRSLSSPEFQAELLQVAKKVRNKLNYKREGPVGEATPSNHREYYAATNQIETSDEQRIDSKGSRKYEEHFEDCRNENRGSREFDDRRIVNRDDRALKEVFDYRRLEHRNSKHMLLKKSATYDDGIDGTRRENNLKSYPDRLETRGHSLDDRLSDKQKREHSEDRWSDQKRHKDRVKSRKFEDTVEVRTRSESPMQQFRDRMDLRGQGSGRESTPEPARSKDSGMSDPRRRKVELRSGVYKNEEHRRSEPIAKTESKELRIKEKLSRKPDIRSATDKNWDILESTEKSPPKSFYFGMDEKLSKETRDCVEQQMDQMQSRIRSRDLSSSPENPPHETDDGKGQHGVGDIALKLRPTLPKKQLEIPRFSPSAAWRLLSALETPCPTMSTASEEGPVLFEERIERLSRPPPPLVALGPRSSHDKSGDSGISGDAGAANDDSLDINMTNRIKGPMRPAWTPQQDLGEESSSDAGVDSPPPMVTPSKFPSRPHIFSLSLPRDDNRMSLYNPEYKNKDSPPFNSLQKLKRSVSGALGLGPLDIDRKHDNDTLDDNWLLSTSAPNSLQHSQANIENTVTTSPGWEPSFTEAEEEEKPDFPMIMKPPSFSYLASGGHVMYLPDSKGSGHHTQSLNHRSIHSDDRNSNASGSKYKKNMEDVKKASRGSNAELDKFSKEPKLPGLLRERSFTNLGINSRKFSNFSKSCENVSEMKQRGRSPSPGPEDLQDAKDTLSEVKVPPKRSSKSKRFTFQSTVRQIERRRLADKLSREAEAKERQRKGELEAMRQVEEEFQKKRAREKANIRQQLRLFSMDENMSSLPPVWDSTQVSRADPDGATSSSASSPTSASPGKLAATRKDSASSDEYQHKSTTISSTDCRQQQHREYKDYRSRYYDWGPESVSHIDFKQTTVHPKVVYDIPKSSPVFVDAKVHSGKPGNLSSTPRSDNYRKDFAHGAVAARSSLASSDSELSQPNTRPHSRQTGNKIKSHRSRSASPARSQDVSSEEECPVEPIKQERPPSNSLMLNAIQPFVREKNYRPISYNPQPPPPIAS